MKVHRYFFVLPLIFYIFGLAAAQPTEPDLEISGFELGIDYDPEAYEHLIEYISKPLNLNIASYSQLHHLILLSESQINQFLDHREKSGTLISYNELQIIPGFDKAIVEKLKLFTTIESPPVGQLKWEGYALIRSQRLIERKKGFTHKNPQRKFEGSPYRHLFKLRISNKHNLDLGLTMEKDEGEKLFYAANRLRPAFMSGYIDYKRSGLLKRIIVGDFIASWGQGLVFGSGFSLGKGRQTTSANKRISTGLSPYKSTIEQGFLRGASIMFGIGPIEFSIIASHNNIHGSLSSDDQVQSISQTGLFRNSIEKQKWNSSFENTFGFNFTFKPENNPEIIAGLNWAYTHFDKKLKLRNNPENLFKTTGYTHQTSGIFFEYRKRNILLFSETAFNLNGQRGLLLGGLVTLSHYLEAILIYRNYSEGFISLYAQNAFRESTLPQNESGIYWGLKFTKSKKLILSAYADVFKFPWLRSSSYRPSFGVEYLMAADFKPNENLSFKFSYKIENKKKNHRPESGSIPVLIDRIRKYFKVDGRVKISKYISYSSGIWFSGYFDGFQNHSGNLIYSSASFRKNKYGINFRVALTDAENYGNRFYLYESDVLYAFNVPVHYGKNIRYYINYKQSITSKMTAWIKWSRTNFRDREFIGSGLDMIDGSIKSEIKIQLIYKL